MNTLTNNELKNVNAGAIKWGVVALIGGIVTFVVGVIDGIVHPNKCK